MTVMKRNYWNLAAAVSLVSVLSLSGTVAQAALSAAVPVLSASAVDATATSKGQAFPSFVFNFNTAFDLAGFEVTVEYDPAKLSFNAAESTLTAGGSTFRLPEALAMMEAASTVPGPGPDFFYSPGPADFGTAITSGSFSFNGAYLNQSYLIPAGSSVIMTGVFNLQPGFVAGDTPVRVFGQVIDPSPAGQSFDVTATVAAVPEPETWLMLLGGLGLIATRARRRSR